MFCSRIINPFLAILAESNQAFKNVQFGIANTMPVSFFGDIDVEANLERNEKRELIGYSAIENIPTNELNNGL